MDDNEGSEVRLGDINEGSHQRINRGRHASNIRHNKYCDDDPLALNFESVCKHNTKRYRCSTITKNEIIHNRSLLYKNVGKSAQDVYLTRLISPCPVIRRRPDSAAINDFTTTFFFRRDSKHMVTVCRDFFLSALGLSKHRVTLIAKEMFAGHTPRERRGGDRKSHNTTDKKNSVRKFISDLPAKESHYNRKKSKRVYLSYELNIRKLYELYNSNVAENLKVKEPMFRRVFNEFNIGFSSPASDVCSTCELLKNKLKIEHREEERSLLKAEYKVHKARAKAFYAKTKESPPNSVSLCFDLQQIQPLPKTPIQESFYLRQIGLYAFCVTDMTTRNPNFFTWVENEANKGSQEIASAVFKYLTSADFSGIEVLRLFADGCGGQNKNSHVEHMLIFWMQIHSPPNLKRIVLTFPVRGHSFLPADRVFGRVEKDLRKKPFMLNPQEYYEIYEKHGKLHKMGIDWHLYDMKKLSNSYKKLEGIRDTKVIIIQKHTTTTTLMPGATANPEHNAQTRGRSRGRVRGRGLRGGRAMSSRGRIAHRVNIAVNVPIARDNLQAIRHNRCGVKAFRFYNTDENEQEWESLLKKSKEHPTLLVRLPINKKIDEKKIKNVETILIKQFGIEWATYPNLDWYTQFFNVAGRAADAAEDGNNDVDDEDNDVDNDESCDCCETDL